MTDKQFKECKRRVHTLLEEWAFGKRGQSPRILTLQQWRIEISYSRETITTPDGDEAGAQVTSEWWYKTATIDFNCSNLLTTGDLELEYVVVHELCHLLVAEMRDYMGPSEWNKAGSRHEERVVTDMAVAFLQTKYYDKRRKSGEVGK